MPHSLESWGNLNNFGGSLDIISFSCSGVLPPAAVTPKCLSHISAFLLFLKIKEGGGGVAEWDKEGKG